MAGKKYTAGAINPTLVDDCVSVTDTFGGSLGPVCSTDLSPTTFTYSKTVTEGSNLIKWA
jgi:hypothetical protein